jgi:4-hydroxy-2-oxoheptanedioate aldolase
MRRANATKEKLKRGETVYGLFHGFAHPLMAELLGLAGYDFVLIDGEHGPGDLMTHLAQIQAIQATPATALLRVASNDPIAFKRALDLGVEGVMVPNVSSPIEAADAVAACRYPSHGGRRGYAASILRASNYGFATEDYLERAAEDLLITVQIETLGGASLAGEIAAVEGVDVVFIGPSDLSGDLGHLNRYDHPDFIRTVQAIEEAVTAQGKVLGCLPYPGTDLAALKARGHRFVCAGSDIAIMREAVRAQVAGLPR